MLIKDKKHFMWGLSLAISFFAVLSYMFTPHFGNGHNAFEASDAMFNSIAKGSTYYLPEITKQAEAFNGEQIEVTVLGHKPELVADAAQVLQKNGLSAEAVDDGLKVSVDLGVIAGRGPGGFRRHVLQQGRRDPGQVRF